jgi:hypothetical protein
VDTRQTMKKVNPIHNARIDQNAAGLALCTSSILRMKSKFMVVAMIVSMMAPMVPKA